MNITYIFCHTVYNVEHTELLTLITITMQLYIHVMIKPGLQLKDFILIQEQKV